VPRREPTRERRRGGIAYAVASSYDLCAAASCLEVGCAPSPEIRRARGCDAPAGGRGNAVECYACGGSHFREPDCPVCEERDGIRALWFDRCPNSAISAATWRFLGTVADAEDGHLPVAGGMLDQAGSWVEAYRFARGLIGRARKKSMEAR
jgi:hypothetical protein